MSLVSEDHLEMYTRNSMFNQNINANLLDQMFILSSDSLMIIVCRFCLERIQYTSKSNIFKGSAF